MFEILSAFSTHFCEIHDVFLLQYAAQLWKTIESEGDLDLPTQVCKHIRINSLEIRSMICLFTEKNAFDGAM